MKKTQIQKLQERIKTLQKKLREARIGEAILFSIIYNDAWDLTGDPEDVKASMEITDKEYNYLKRRLNKSYFELPLGLSQEKK